MAYINRQRRLSSPPVIHIGTQNEDLEQCAPAVIESGPCTLRSKLQGRPPGSHAIVCRLEGSPGVEQVWLWFGQAIVNVYASAGNENERRRSIYDPSSPALFVEALAGRDLSASVRLLAFQTHRACCLRHWGKYFTPTQRG